MFRYDIFVKQPPAMQVDEGMVRLDFYSGDTIFGCVMSLSAFARGLADAKKLYAMWEAEQSGRFVQEFPVRNRARDKPDEDHAA